MRRRTESSVVAHRSIFVRRGSALAIVLRAATSRDTVTKPLTNCLARERPFYIAMSRLIARQAGELSWVFEPIREKHIFEEVCIRWRRSLDEEGVGVMV
jgi:hypothetical protein